MFEDRTKRTEISELGEFGLIDHLTKSFELEQESSIFGVGDDAAVINPKDKQVLISTDLLVEGIHFDLTYVPLKHLGYKAAIVNFSDMAAMNALPTQITVSIALSNRFSLEAIEEFYPDGLIILLIYGGLFILFIKVLRERLSNKEDDYYSKEIRK